MNSLRVIVYNVPQDEYEQAVALAAKAYQQRYGTAPQSVTLPKDVAAGLVLFGGALDVGGLQLEIDRFYASPGTCQVGR